MKIVATNVEYESIVKNLYYIEGYWDGPLVGYIKINGELMHFVKDIKPSVFHKAEVYTYTLYSLTKWEQKKAKIDRFLFELFVGYHNSYPKRDKKKYFSWQWFYYNIVIKVF